MGIKLSIIVPCYKVEAYLARCLDSLVTQTLEDIEIICINDGSPDGCLAILNAYAQKYPHKIIVIDKHNEGVWRGRRDGIALARGEYIGFLDSDDYALPEFAEALYSTATSADADIAVCGFNRVDMDTNEILTEELADVRSDFSIAEDPGRLLELNGAPWNKVFRASLLKNLPDLEHPPAILDDLMFHLLTYIAATGRVAFCPQSLVHYMIRKDSIITTIHKEQVDSTFSAMVETKQLYEQAGCPESKYEMLASSAFLHLGISLLFRLMYDPSCQPQLYIRHCVEFLDAEFPRWRRSPYLTLPYALSHRSVFPKLWIARCAYRLHIIGLFMRCYCFAIDKLHIDIKW